MLLSCSVQGWGGGGGGWGADNVYANSVCFFLLRAGVILRKRRKHRGFCVIAKNSASSRFNFVFLQQIALTVMTMVRMMMMMMLLLMINNKDSDNVAPLAAVFL